MPLSLLLFCGSRAGSDPAHTETAREFGAWCASEGIRLIYGGGGIGLMGEAARASLSAGGEVIGVIPRFLMREEVAQTGLTEMHVVETLHARKGLMHELCDAVVALPGSIGTLDELFEAMTWRELGLHAKPIFLVGANGYWDPFMVLLRHLDAQGFAPPDLFDLVESLPGVPDLAERLLGRASPATARSIET
ncbi:LOG family protein [Glacieibacterium frigidum]|uniref:Cytokinin riboside 5'-monophosphate phosphoribohydrolase n=1 Tax=Glacieibacterium frigidum TaxID=2593303 RepID=A0A552UHY4_9SPHN|nr:TIGR00730 family Rossman fold protein [Glacieibacterium frigidum]TRW17834.1 TIGR00730 family Rossman fold protein [Glacieibacterium frigidum]